MLRTLGLILVAGGSCAGAYWLGTTLGRSGTTPPPTSVQVVEGLEVDAADLDAGEVWERPDFVHPIVIRNRRSATAEIKGFVASCGCLMVEQHTLAIPAGETATVRLKLDLTHRALHELGQAVRPLHVEIRPFCKGVVSQESGWLLHGVVKSALTLDTLSLHLGDALVSGAAPFSRKVRATMHVPGGSLRATANPDLVTVDVRQSPGETNEFELDIAPRKGLPVGPFTCNLKLEVVSPAGEVLPGATLPIRGTTQPPVRALPARLLLGSRRIGSTAQATVTLQVPEGENWRVDHIEVESTDVVVDAVAVAGIPAGRTYRVRQRIVLEGPQTSAVRFVVRKGGGPLEIVAMAVCYDGDAVGTVSGTGAKERKP
jgi:hypothetical protein